MGLRSNWERDPQFGNIVPGAFTPVLAKYSKSSVRRLSFRGRTAVPLHAFCPDVGPKWSRSPPRGDLPESRFWTARASEKSGYLRIADYSRTCLNANKMGSISSRHSIRITITRD